MPKRSEPNAPCLADQADLRILATTDLHLHLFPYDYYSDQPTDTVGLARTATLIARARAEVEHSVLLDNGDFLFGNPMGDLITRIDDRRTGAMHPMIAAMNLLAYDAVALGNHEFDHGLDCLSNALGSAQFPVLCANVDVISPVTCAFQPWTMIERTIRMNDGREFPLRIGVIGFLPPQILVWNQSQLKGQVVVRDMIDAAVHMLPQMRAAGADAIVALAHTGIGAMLPTAEMENAATALAGLPEIDAVVAGHSHLVFPALNFEPLPGVDPRAGTLCGKPAVMAGYGGSHLGVIDLRLTRFNNIWKICKAQSSVRPIFQRTPEWSARPLVTSTAGVLNVAADAHAATLAQVRRPIGKTDVDLNTYFALVAPSACSALVAEAQRRHVVACLEGTEHEFLPVLSAASPFKAGGRAGVSHYTYIPQGEIALRHLADLYPFPNAIRAVRVSGAFVADWLERSACLYNQVTAGVQDQPLINPQFPSYNFDTIHGLTYRIDLSQPARFGLTGQVLSPSTRRIVNLCMNGIPLNPTDSFVVATNSYRVAGLDEFTLQKEKAVEVLESVAQTRDMLVRHVTDHGPISAFANEPSWRFERLPGTSVLFDTSPNALRFLDQLGPQLQIASAGWGDDGFARFRIHL
jgi:2',3'-cyclic-nucleotide 2'-phosphodiesterase/3'-nucleotidase